MIRIAFLVSIVAVIGSGSLCAEVAKPNEPLFRIDAGKIYGTVNDEPILGKDVLEVLVEEAWDKYLESFVDYAIRREEVEKAKITVPDAEVSEELKEILRTKAGQLGMNEAAIERNYGAGMLEALKRSIRVDLGLMKIFHDTKKLDSSKRTLSPEFDKLKRLLVENRIRLAGVKTDPRELGNGEAVRIGPRPYSRDEVRRFILDAEGQIPKTVLQQIVQQLELEKLVKTYAATKGAALTEDDRKFHFSYLCRLGEQQTGVPGRALMMQQIQKLGLTPEQYLLSRVFSFDALLTVIVKQKIKLGEIKAEFARNPDKYRVSESLIAHIFVQVLDPDGHPYGPNWQAPGHVAPNEYARAMREEKFQAAKTKIDGMVQLAKENFDETARNYSDDTNKRAGGLIGRLGKNTIPVRPLDQSSIDTAVKLKPGEQSEPIRSEYGWHIFKCLEKQDVTYEEVEERVYLTLIHEAREALHEKLLQTAKVEEKF